MNRPRIASEVLASAQTQAILAQTQEAYQDSLPKTAPHAEVMGMVHFLGYFAREVSTYADNDPILTELSRPSEAGATEDGTLLRTIITRVPETPQNLVINGQFNKEGTTSELFPLYEITWGGDIYKYDLEAGTPSTRVERDDPTALPIFEDVHAIVLLALERTERSSLDQQQNLDERLAIATQEQDAYRAENLVSDSEAYVQLAAKLGDYVATLTLKNVTDPQEVLKNKRLRENRGRYLQERYSLDPADHAGLTALSATAEQKIAALTKLTEERKSIESQKITVDIHLHNINKLRGNQ